MNSLDSWTLLQDRAGDLPDTLQSVASGLLKSDLSQSGRQAKGKETDNGQF